jgi:hypothetical protein
MEVGNNWTSCVQGRIFCQRELSEMYIFVCLIPGKMLQIGETLISLDVLEEHFCCDLAKCKGACCVHGDAGAPLTSEEVLTLPRIIDRIKPFLRSEGIRAIESQGTHVIDDENEPVTPLIDNKECAFVVFNQGIAFCGIEKAWEAGEIDFRKPVSCHLYPIRIRKYEKLTAVNYDTWDICNPAREHGAHIALPVFQFVKDALVRRFGQDWYHQLEGAYNELKKKNVEK